MVLFVVTLAAEFLANDRPIIASIDGITLYPIFVDYEENDILEEDPFNLPVVDFRAPHIEEAFQEKQGWMIWLPSAIPTEPSTSNCQNLHLLNHSGFMILMNAVTLISLVLMTVPATSATGIG